uniref:Uncharacterized protein n=1 Tax=Acanthochromis polyacanthus TaxID=80966 RepID=A0A3Q1EKV3_9TELE
AGCSLNGDFVSGCLLIPHTNCFVTHSLLSWFVSGGTSTLRLSSVRELPGQLHELYQQGFVLAAVHPFIHPCGPESNSPQHQLYRAILVRLSDG